MWIAVDVGNEISFLAGMGGVGVQSRLYYRPVLWFRSNKWKIKTISSRKLKKNNIIIDAQKLNSEIYSQRENEVILYSQLKLPDQQSAGVKWESGSL